MKTGFIPDGYTAEGFCAETDFYPAVHFQYRPCVGTEHYGFNAQQVALFKSEKPKDSEQARKNIATLLAKHLVSWDLLSPDGNPVEISLANLLRVEPNLSAKLYGIVMGYEPNDDEKPDEKKADLGN